LKRTRRKRKEKESRHITGYFGSDKYWEKNSGKIEKEKMKKIVEKNSGKK